MAYADTDAETVKNAKPAFKVVQRNCESLYLPVLGQCYFGGSGGGALLTWIKERGQLLTTRLIPGSLGTFPDAICQKLVFEETFVRLGAPSPFSSLLEGGCGGFYESLQLRYSPEPIDPLTTCHLHLRVIEDTIEVTRCIIYFTKPSDEEPRRRIAFIASLVNRPCQIVPSKARAHQISYEIVDIVACAPFWDDTSNREHKHMAFGAAHEIWSKAEISIEVVALTMFTDQASIPLEAVAQLSDEGQFRAVNELATRSQTVTTLNEPSSPVVELRRSNGQATICLDLVWLLPLVEKFRSTDTSPHVVISDEDGFRVLT